MYGVCISGLDCNDCCNGGEMFVFIGTIIYLSDYDLLSLISMLQDVLVCLPISWVS